MVVQIFVENPFKHLIFNRSLCKLWNIAAAYALFYIQRRIFVKTVKGKETTLSKKYFWSFLMVVLAIDLVISFALSVTYSTVQIKRTADHDVAQLEQACNSTDILYNSMEAAVNQVITDSRTLSFLLSSETDRLQEASLGIYLRTLRTANPYMRYITLYNDTSKRFVSSSDAGYGNELGADEIYAKLGSSPYTCFLRLVGSVHVTQHEKKLQTYAFVFPIEINKNGSKDLLIIDVKDSYFYQALEPIRISGKEQTLLLRDAQSEVIAEMTASAEQTSFQVAQAQNEHWPKSPTNEALGSFFYGSFPNRKFISYATSLQAGWTIYNIQPASVMYAGISSILLPSAVMMLATLGLGWLLSRRLSFQLYAPIKTLYENYVTAESLEEQGNELELLSAAFSEMYSKADRLEQGLIASFHESKNLYLRYLLSGEEQKVRAAISTYERLRIDLDAPHYGIILIECVPQSDEAGESRSQQEANLFICFYALENITREVLSGSRSIEFLRVEENQFAVLLSLETETLPKPMQDGLDTVAATMQREFHIDTTICVGNTANSWSNINLAYEQAKVALNSHSPSNYGRVFFARNSSHSMSSELYYNKMHSKLVEYIRSEDIDACSAEFDRALTAMEDISFNTAKTYFKHVLMSVLDDFSVSFEKDDSSFEQLMDYLGQIDNCQNVQLLKTAFLGFLSDLCHRLSYNRKNSNQDAALNAKDYIDRNFQNPDLSLRMLAERVGLSSAYLGKVFTAVTTYTFNDYLNNVRTARAAELLTTTKLPVSKISEEVGILNTNYFYSVFKKRYGVTPSAYRKDPPAGTDE